ncbi:MAG: response regulator transcription factor, partial [Acidimicrobiales bacterium]
DYVTKPFSPRELVARVEAILRRVNDQNSQAGTVYRCGLEIDIDTRRVRRDGAAIHLTPTEFDLLVGLSKAGGSVLSREDLLMSVWGYPDGSGARTVDSHIRSLRRKLGNDVIRTVHGVGYAIGDDEAA